MSASYFAPHTLDEAIEVIAQHGPGLVAGGTDYFPSRGRAPLNRNLMDLTRLSELRGIEKTGEAWRIGASATWGDVARFGFPPAFDALRQAAVQVGSVQIQNTATVAGNLCNASPAADGVPPLLILEAEVALAGPEGRRHLPLHEFLKGPRQTDLRPGELMVALHVPLPPAGALSAFEKLGARRYLVISIAMTAVLLVLDAQGTIAEARVAVGACSPVARRLPALEASLSGQDPRAVVIDRSLLGDLAPISDVRADAAYREEAVPHQIARAIRKAAGHG